MSLLTQYGRNICQFNKKTPNLMTWNSSKHLLSPTFCGLAEKFWLSVSPEVAVECESMLPSLEGLAEAGSASTALTRVASEFARLSAGGFGPSVWGPLPRIVWMSSQHGERVSLRASNPGNQDRSCNTFCDFTSENTQCHAIAPQSHRAVSIQCGRGSHKMGTARGPSWRLAMATSLIQEQDIESNSPRINPFQSI